MTQFQDPAFKIATFTVDRWCNVSLLVRLSILSDGLTKLKWASFQGFPDSKLVLVLPPDPIQFFGKPGDRVRGSAKASDMSGCTTLFKRLLGIVFPVDGTVVDIRLPSHLGYVAFVAIVVMIDPFLVAVCCCDRLKFSVVPKVTQLFTLSRVRQAFDGVIARSTDKLARQTQPSSSCWTEQCFAS